ncbi:hypothetical protein KY289_002907 [Solanum tuberosum]|nr:hypothetical protein KY289_002907 [Solanum tuberosum]
MQRAEDWHFHIGNLLTADCRKGSAGSFLLNMDPRSTKDNFLFYLNSSRGFRLNNVKLKEEDNPHYMVLKIMICAVEHTHSMMSGTERKLLKFLDVENGRLKVCFMNRSRHFVRKAFKGVGKPVPIGHHSPGGFLSQIYL